MNDLHFERLFDMTMVALSACVEVSYDNFGPMPIVLDKMSKSHTPTDSVYILTKASQKLPLADGKTRFTIDEEIQILSYDANAALSYLVVPDAPRCRSIALRMKKGNLDFALPRPTVGGSPSYEMEVSLDLEGFRPVEQARFKINDNDWQELEIGSTVISVDGNILFSLSMGSCEGVRMRLIYL